MTKTCLLAALLVFANSGVSLASTGKAIIPHLHARHTTNDNRVNTYVRISNISNESVSVSVTFYNHGGVVATDTDDNPNAGHIYAHKSFTNYDDTHSDKSVTFDLDANETASLTLLSDSNGLASTMQGYGVIEWSSPNVNGVALVSHVTIDNFYREATKERWATYSVEVNNGQPF